LNIYNLVSYLIKEIYIDSIMNNHLSYKVIIIGSACVGKTSLVNSIFYVSRKFNPHQAATIGASFHSHRINNDIKIDFWDTAGQERYNSLLKLYYRNAELILLVYDMNDYQETLNRVIDQINEIEEHHGTARFVLIGNKSDLLTPEQQKTVNNYVSGKINNDKIIAKINTSAKINNNIEALNDIINDHIKKLHKQRHTENGNIIENIIIKQETNKKSSWLEYC
jgi:Ras-related protein Rab-5C